MLAGPGAILVVLIALFVHIFTSIDAKPWIIGGLVVFFFGFLPLYSVEYFRQEFQADIKKRILFKRANKRTEWGGGNVHGTTPKTVKRHGKIFKK